MERGIWKVGADRADLNRRPHPYQGCALPTELYQRLERAAGIEPTSLAWKAKVIAIIRCPQS